MESLLDELMRRKGFNRYQLSKAMKVSPSTVTRWCKGSIVPRYDVLMRLCGLLECTTDDVLRGMRGDGVSVEVPKE